MLHLILVRHAETEWNRLRRIQGTSDIPLNPAGMSQAELVGAYLQSHSFNAIFSSPLKRAMQTADEIARRQTAGRAIPADALREISYGSWEAALFEDIPEKWPVEWASYRADPARNRPPGGEKIEMLLTRTQAFVDDLRHTREGQSLCIVGHSGTIRGILCGALCGTPDTWVRLSVWNASVSEVLFNDTGRAEVLRVNDHSFLHV